MRHIFIVFVMVALAGCSNSHNGMDTDAGGDPGENDAGPGDVDAGPGATTSITIPPDALSGSGPSMPGGQSPGYTTEVDPDQPLDGEPTVVLSAPDGATGMDWGASVGVLAIDESYHGRRYRMRTQLRTDDAATAFAWFRIDLSDLGYVLDNMVAPVDRGLHGTQEWTEVELVLDVPDGAHQFAFGSGLIGGGRVWIGPVTFEEVGRDVPTTPYTAAVP